MHFDNVVFVWIDKKTWVFYLIRFRPSILFKKLPTQIIRLVQLFYDIFDANLSKIHPDNKTAVE